MATKMDLALARKQFTSTVANTASLVSSLREKAGPRPLPSKVKVTSPGSDEFQATTSLIRRLHQIQNKEKAEIVCMDIGDGSKMKNGHAKVTCEGLRSFWARNGTSPVISHSQEPIAAVASRSPEAIFIDSQESPPDIPGYLRVQFSDPQICLFVLKD